MQAIDQLWNHFEKKKHMQQFQWRNSISEEISRFKKYSFVACVKTSPRQSCK